MMASIQQFGLPADAAEYVLRPGGYAVIFDAAGNVALLETPSGMVLPGGGQHPGESPEKAAIRETLEECGLRISIVESLGVADELLFAAAEGIHFRKRCLFVLAEPIGVSGSGESDHKLLWMAPEGAQRALRFESQRWGVALAQQARHIASISHPPRTRCQIR